MDIWVIVVALAAWVLGFVSGFFALAWIAAVEMEKAVNDG